MVEPETVRQQIVELTETEFEIGSVPEGHPASYDSVWFIQFSDFKKLGAVPYLNSIWETREGEIVMQSSSMGDSIDWIEAAYGEEAAGKSLEIDYSSFGSKEFREQFRMEYPRIARKVQAYEEIAIQVSKRHGLDLQLRENGSKGIVIFSFAVKLTPETKSLGKKLRAGVEALQEAWDLADVLEAGTP